MSNTKITIGITTYNLDNFIEKCLDSILCQKTNFNFKILIVDDASTDNTQKILQKYKEEYPNKIDLILKEKNGGSLESSNILFNKIKTEYFSFIDGDDYWLTENCLQEAIDFLDEHLDYTMYGANTIYMRNGILDKKIIKNDFLNKTFDFNDYLNQKCPFVHTSAIVLRNIVYNNGIPQEYIDNEKTIFNCVFRGEDIRFIEHLRKGKIYISSKDNSVYRIHNGGMWQGTSEKKRILETCLSNVKYPDIFPETRNLNLIRLQNSYKKLMSLIADKYTLNDTEYNLYIGLLKELNSRKDICWDTEIIEIKKPKIKKLKYKIYHHIYKKIKKKLEKKGYI